MRAVLIGILWALGFVAPVGAADDLTKPIHVSPDGRFLAAADGSPFFFLAENAEYLLWRLTREETDLYLKDRAQKGFTVVMAHVVPRGRMDLPNAYGQAAFLEGDVTRPNPRYFEHVDWVVDRAAHYGLRMALQPINGIEYVSQGKFTAANVEAYGRWLGKRYRARGIIWVLGHDSTPVWPSGSWKPDKVVLADFRAVYDRMAEAIAATSGGDAFVTYHPPCCSFSGTAEPRTSQYWGDRAWLDMNMLQTSHFADPSEFLRRSGLAFGWSATHGYVAVQKEYDSLPVRPVVDGEPHWEGMLRDLYREDGERWDAADIRNSAYAAVFAGAAGHSYGHVSVYAYVEPGREDRTSGFIKYAQSPWRQALDATGAQQLGRLKALMLSRPYFTRIPDQSVVAGPAGEGTARISATRDRAGSYIMVYTPRGEAVTVDLRKLSGASAIAWWFDPREGTSRRVPGTYATNRPHMFEAPSRGEGADWVLVIDDASRQFTPPGSSLGR